MKTPVQRYLDGIFSEEEELYDQAEEVLAEVGAIGKRDAWLVLEALYREMPPKPNPWTHRWYTIFALIQNTEDPEAIQVFRNKGTEPLLNLYPRLDQDEKAFCLKILALIGTPEGLQKIVTELTNPNWPADYMVAVILDSIADDVAGVELLFPALESILSNNDFKAVALIDFANRFMRLGRLQVYPYPNCIPLLRTWIEERQSELYSYAVTACAALCYLPGAESIKVLNLAKDHPDPMVRLEALYSLYSLGETSVRQDLLELSLNPAVAERVFDYLAELGLEDEIPLKARKPEYQALCKMVSWLMHPNEYGAPPDQIELWDKRELFWPPTGDVRMLYLFRYRYVDRNDQADEVGVGMTGSVTFSLFGEAENFKTPEDAYAAYCMWELELNDDPRAVEGRPIEVGKRLLGFIDK